ncbi:type II secretion system F family protein [Streptomyces sp. KR80]|uniref:type II secretion system F family protein n=1 Tax=Streptomyces sp. KR80 TaxID=3457426 RepID=UPI003FCF4F1A
MTGELFPGLGVLTSVVAVLALIAVARSVRRKRVVRRRLAAVIAAQSARRGLLSALRDRLSAWNGLRSAAVRDWWPPAAVGLTGFVLIGGMTGCVAGLAAAYGMARWWRGRRGSSEHADDVAAVERQLPLAADLLAACLAAGAGPCEAAAAVGRSLGGPVGERLAHAAAELRLGAEPADAWGRLGTLPAGTRLARCLERAQAAGAPVVEQVTSLALVCRADRAREATAGARRAAVLATAPLGLCFLPAFLAVGVAPVVIGLASGLVNRG